MRFAMPQAHFPPWHGEYIIFVLTKMKIGVAMRPSRLHIWSDIGHIWRFRQAREYPIARVEWLGVEDIRWL